MLLSRATCPKPPLSSRGPIIVIRTRAVRLLSVAVNPLLSWKRRRGYYPSGFVRGGLPGGGIYALRESYEVRGHLRKRNPCHRKEQRDANDQSRTRTVTTDYPSPPSSFSLSGCAYCSVGFGCSSQIPLISPRSCIMNDVGQPSWLGSTSSWLLSFSPVVTGNRAG